MSSNRITRLIWICSSIAIWLLMKGGVIPSSAGADDHRVLFLVQKMESALKSVEDYTCEVEQIFYQGGEESQRYQFKLYFKRGKTRVDFSRPHSSLTIFYTEGEKEATVLPLRYLPALKFRLSIDNPIIRTPAGQWINQTGMDYFIKFLYKNLEKIEQKSDEFHEDRDQISFLVWGLDYIAGKKLEKYRIFVSKQIWLPVRIERYHAGGDPVEVTIIQNYALNSRLNDRIFSP